MKFYVKGIIPLTSLMIGLIFILVTATFVWAKDFDFSITGSVALDKGRWGSGSVEQPGGTHKDAWIGGNYGVQVKYNRWKFQPTLEVGFRKEKLDFSDIQAPIQLANPAIWRVLVGVSTELKYFTAYGLAGISFYKPNANLGEFDLPVRVCTSTCALLHADRQTGLLLWHGSNRGVLSKIVTFKLGAYRLFDVGVLGLKIGPEISTEIFTEKPGFKRCRNFSTNLFLPSAGLRVQW